MFRRSSTSSSGWAQRWREFIALQSRSAPAALQSLSALLQSLDRSSLPRFQAELGPAVPLSVLLCCVQAFRAEEASGTAHGLWVSQLAACLRFLRLCAAESSSASKDMSQPLFRLAWLLTTNEW
jgi:hypothetical protein